MTNLEFIDKYIEILEQKIESSKESARLYYANDDYEFGKMEEENRVGYEEELKLFKQSKAELEAWEVAKVKEVDFNDLIHQIILYKRHNEGCSKITEQYNLGKPKRLQLNDKEVEKLKKAMEEKDE